MTLYVFDMDGTLTPARLPMTSEFATEFSAFQKNHKTFIATGSDFKKVEEQLQYSVIEDFTGVYCSMGNVLWSKGKIVYQKDFAPNPRLFDMLENFRKITNYPGDLFPNYIEQRIGMINFSVLGRDCPYTEREKYTAWDSVVHERLKIQAVLQQNFPEYDIAVGGTISMDITPKGCGKGQIAAHLRKTYPDEKIIFFGDKTFAGGNDFELADALNKLPNTQVVQVNEPSDVLKFLSKEV
ncbi:MAG: HAD-IIB family hydrolase [Alphaproteobacteria bacterium]|nr:HAD-IIB family hydrolase [Alphaproteobacteria bacterium]